MGGMQPTSVCICAGPGRSRPPDHHIHRSQGGIKEIGFLKLGSRSLVDVGRCDIATPAINERLATLREEVRARARKAL